MTTNYTPEQLKKLAEFAGIKPNFIQEGDEHIYFGGYPYPMKYDPLHNDAQAFELLRKLYEHERYEVRIFSQGRVEILDHEKERLWWKEGQTLNETICNAVLALLESPDDTGE